MHTLHRWCFFFQHRVIHGNNSRTELEPQSLDRQITFGVLFVRYKSWKTVANIQKITYVVKCVQSDWKCISHDIFNTRALSRGCPTIQARFWMHQPIPQPPFVPPPGKNKYLTWPCSIAGFLQAPSQNPFTYIYIYIYI